MTGRRAFKVLHAGGGGTTGTGTGNGSCACSCISEGDIEVEGDVTTSRWSIAMGTEIFTQAFGTITFPAGDYIVVYDSGSGTWILDIGDVLTSKYTSGVDATSATTMDGTLTMGFDVDGVPYITLCVTGTVPEEP